MSGSDLAVIGAPADELVVQIREAIQSVESLPLDDATEVYERASVTEAAAAKARAETVQLAAAELRLHAERRLGELLLSGLPLPAHFKESQLRDFERLAKIPRSFHDRSAAILGGKTERIDLFLRAVRHQIDSERSQTAYSVHMAARHMSATRDLAKHRGIAQTWDGAWEIIYRDPRTKRARVKILEGTLEQVLEQRAVLEGRISPHSTKLLPVRGQDPLAQTLDHVRQARDALSACWPALSDDQKRELGSAYSQLDDLATAIVRAVGF